MSSYLGECFQNYRDLNEILLVCAQCLFPRYPVHQSKLILRDNLLHLSCLIDEQTEPQRHTQHGPHRASRTPRLLTSIQGLILLQWTHCHFSICPFRSYPTPSLSGDFMPPLFVRDISQMNPTTRIQCSPNYSLGTMTFPILSPDPRSSSC